MSEITITNNSRLPIHVATEWDSIVQEFRNYLLPGQQVTLPSANFGWQDLFVIVGVKETEISHANDWRAALSFGTFIAGAIATYAGVVLTVITYGTAAPIVLGGITMMSATVATAASAAVAASSAIVFAGSAAVVISGRINLKPTIVTGLWGHDGYHMTVTGGDINGFYHPDGGIFYVNEVKPLVLSWRNNVSGNSGVVGCTR